MIKLTLTPCFKQPLPFSNDWEPTRVALYLGTTKVPAAIVDIEDLYMANQPDGDDNSVYSELIKGNEVILHCEAIEDAENYPNNLGE